jgi:lipopolysaccharide export system protein LptA
MKGFVALKKVFYLILLLFAGMHIYAQQPVDTEARKQIIIIHADKIGYKESDSVTKFQVLVGNVAVQQEKTKFYCDSASINTTTNILEAFGHVHINDNDSLQIYSNYLKYLGHERKAKLTNNVKLTDGKGVLTTNQLDYDLQTKIGIYSNGGKVVNEKTVLTSEEATYYEQTRDVFFKRNVVLVDPEYTIKTDTLLYNTYTGITTFIVPTEIISDSGRQRIVTSDGYYDTKAKKAYFGKRPKMWNQNTYVEADEVASDSTGFGEARGNVIYKDTAQKVTIFANHMNTNKNDNSFLATEKPVMVIQQDEDSVFIAADTLYSARLSDLRKYRHVPDIGESVTQKSQLARDSGYTEINEDTPGAIADSSQMEENNNEEESDTAAVKKDSTVKNYSAKADSSVTIKDTILAAKEGVPTVKGASQMKAKEALRRKASSRFAIKDTSQFTPKDTSQFAIKDTSQFTPKDTSRFTINDTSLATNDTTRFVANNTLQSEKDSLQLVANDTSHVKDTDSTDRFFEAYYHVRIYSDSMQAVGDSLFYSAKDSVFRLFKQPIVWTKENQVTGDTIYLYTQNKKPKRMYVFENAMAISKVDSSGNFYNQVKGRTINGYFNGGNIEFMRAKGNSESVYYAQDEGNKFIGVNKATADIIDMYFDEKKPQRVVFRSNLVGTSYPMRQVNHEELKLRGFKWLEQLRPKSQYDLFTEAPVIKEETNDKEKEKNNDNDEEEQ